MKTFIMQQKRPFLLYLFQCKSYVKRLHRQSSHADATGRRSRTPERDAIAASERLRSGELNRRKSRNMSLDSMSSAATKELENDQLRLEKKSLEDEIGRIGKHLEEIRRESSLVISSTLCLQNFGSAAHSQPLTATSST